MWVENADSYSTNDPDEIREYFKSNQKRSQESATNCCPWTKNSPNLNEGSVGSVSEPLSLVGVGLGVVEEGKNLIRSSHTIVIPVYNETGQTIAGWNVISKQTGQVLKYVKAGTSSSGYATGGISVVVDATEMVNGDLSGARFGYHAFGTATATAAGVYVTAGLGAIVGLTFIIGENVYDGWMNEIQPQIDKGYSKS